MADGQADGWDGCLGQGDGDGCYGHHRGPRIRTSGILMSAPALASERTDRPLARVPLHPLLLAAWPVLRLYGDNVNEFVISEVLLPMAAALGLAVAVLALLTLVWRDPRRAAIVATALVVPLLTFGLVATAVAPLWPPDPMWPHEPSVRAYGLALAVWAVVLTMAAYMATKLRRRLSAVTEALNLVAIALVIVAIIPVATHEVATRSHETFTSEGAGNATVELAPQEGRPARDIYHIVLDRYGSKDALALGRGIDNSDYLESLRERGFQVVDESYANFGRTLPSLASTFSMSLLDDVAEQMGPDSPNWSPLVELVKASPAGSTLQDLGYHYIHVGSWYPQTATSDTADQIERPVHLIDLNSVLLDQSAVTGLTVIADVFIGSGASRSVESVADTTLTQVERLHAVAEQPGGPKYVFAHLLVPHDPFVLLGDGTIAPEAATFATQLEFANAELDQLFERLLDVPPGEQPVIIVQGDEGPWPDRYRPQIEEFDWETASSEELVTKFGVLNAMYLPGPEGAQPLPDGMTLVNTYPEVLERYFGIEVDRSEDRIFVTMEDRPYDRLEITDRIQRASDNLGLTDE